MSYKVQNIEWEISGNDLQKGEPVGYQIELGRNEQFNPILYEFTTFTDEDEIDEHGRLFYSTDDGTTWIVYPSGDDGKTFYEPYRLRFQVHAGDTGSIFVENAGSIHRIAPDAGRLESTYASQYLSDVSDVGFDTSKDILLAVGEDTLFKIDTNRNSISPYGNSINQQSSNTLGVVSDGNRESFWQIDRDRVYLKNQYGEIIFFKEFSFDGDIDWSSSSES